jgi:hypothetical protein
MTASLWCSEDPSSIQAPVIINNCSSSRTVLVARRRGVSISVRRASPHLRSMHMSISVSSASGDHDSTENCTSPTRAQLGVELQYEMHIQMVMSAVQIQRRLAAEVVGTI